MTYPLVQFVTAPDPDAEVRLDLNSDFGLAQCAVTADDFSLGAPSFTGEPGGVGGVYGYRTLNITPRITGPKVAALQLLSLLAREQGRASNWVHFKLDEMTPSVWYYVYQAAPQPLSLAEVDASGRNPDAWTTSLSLPSDAFAYGERVTLGPYSVTQSPDGDYPMSVVLPEIEGDAPTALRVTVAPTSSSYSVNFGSSWLVGCLAGSASMSSPVIDLGDAGDDVTNLSGTGAATPDATYFGGGYRTVTVGAATPNLLSRFRVDLPTSIPVGQYKVMLRCRYVAGTAKTLLFRLQQGQNSSVSVLSPATRSVSVDTEAFDTGRDFWVDLSEINIPFGVLPPSDAGGTIPAPILVLHIGTADGSATSVNVDAIKLVPVGGPEVTTAALLKIVSPAWWFAGMATQGTLDGDLETTWGTASTVYQEASQSLQGTFPVANPAVAQNTLLVMALDSGPESVAAGTYISATDAEAEVTVSYQPRKLHL